MPEIAWIAPRPDRSKLAKPEGPSSYFLDAHASGDEDLARAVWQEFRGKILKPRPLDRPGSTGSWNHWPVAAVAAYLAEPDEIKADHLRVYCRRQLGRDPIRHDLWGKELLSRVYPWPPAALALAFDRLPDPDLRDYLAAHAYLLALFALPDPHPEGDVDDLFICAPGMRSAKREDGSEISFLAACMMRPRELRPRPKLDGPRRVEWPRRAAWASSHDYLDAEEKDLLWRHRTHGDEAQAIVDRLNDLGVALRTPVQVRRYASGDFLAMARENLHGSTPPIMAFSRVDGVYRHLLAHPQDFRGGGGRRMGHPSKCLHDERDGVVRAVFEGAVLENDAAPQDLQAAIPAPSTDQELLYAVRLGPEKIAFLDPAQRSANLLSLARLIGRAAEPPHLNEDDSIVRHGRAIGRLAARETPDLEKIYLHAVQLARQETDAPTLRRIRNCGRQATEIYEWWEC